jgi:hypothetical protein
MQELCKKCHPIIAWHAADYQPEREEYLEQLGAQRIEHSLLMSRSVWAQATRSQSNGFGRITVSGNAAKVYSQQGHRYLAALPG